MSALTLPQLGMPVGLDAGQLILISWNGSAEDVLSLDPQTGTTSLLGSIADLKFVSVTYDTYDPASHTLYVLGSNANSQSFLYEFNTVSGQTLTLPQSGIPVGIESGHPILINWNGSVEEVLSLNPQTGSTTLLGHIANLKTFSLGTDIYDAGTHTLYVDGSDGSGAGSHSFRYVFNTATGQTSTLSPAYSPVGVDAGQLILIGWNGSAEEVLSQNLQTGSTSSLGYISNLKTTSLGDDLYDPSTHTLYIINFNGGSPSLFSFNEASSSLPPLVSSISMLGDGIIGGNGDLSAGKLLTVVVTMNEAVTVAGGVPTLTLNNGGAATYTGSSGSTALTFSYTVLAGQNSSDLVVSSLNLNGATMTDSAGNNADLSVASNYNPTGLLQIDTVAPQVTVSLLHDYGPSGNDKVTSDSTLTGSGDPNAVVHFNVDGVAITETATANASGLWMFALANLADGAHAIVASETDLAGNTAVAALSFTLDTTAPTLTSITHSDPSLTNASTVHYTVAFSEPVTGVNLSDFTLSTSGITGASVTSVAPVSGSNGTQFSVTINTGSGDDTLALDFVGTSVHDVVGNPLSYELFGAESTYAAGPNPSSVAIADFNGDGKPDLVVGSSSNTFSILPGDGKGTFHTRSEYMTDSPSPDQTYSVAVADVNGDGKLDLVTANGLSNTVSILLGNGDSTFQVMSTYATDSNPNSVAVGDLNGDGKPDLVVGNVLSGTISLLLGNGDGTFQTQSTFAAGSYPLSVSVGDLNGDGLPDLVVANEISDTVSVMLGNGNGTFQALSKYATGLFPFSVAVADLNGDGKVDLSVANESSNTVSVLLGNGNGTFQPQSTYAVGPTPWSVAVADVNGDGEPDLIVASNTDEANSISVLLGNGDGTFRAQSTYATNSNSYFLAVGDLNEDGRPDLVIANIYSNSVSVLLGIPPEVVGPLYQIDRTVPTVVENLLSDTGISPSDNITSNPVLTGSGDSNTFVHFAIDGTAITGTAIANESGVWMFTPTGLADGSHTIVASETDATGNTGMASMTFILVTQLNAHNDAYVSLQGQALSVAASHGVLVNDQTVSPAITALVTGPAHGAIQLAADGSLSYSSAAGFTGIDSFTYIATDASGVTGNAEGLVYVVPVVVGAITTLNLAALTPEEQIASTYVAFFGRGADAGGFEFWVNQFHIGEPTQGAAAVFANIASAFAPQPETIALYPFFAHPQGASDAQVSTFLDSVYHNLFNRPGDAGGLAYWTGQIQATVSAGQGVGSVLINIMSGAQDTPAAHDITTLMGKVAVSLEYVQQQEQHNTVWAGASDNSAAAALLHSVTADSQTVLVGIKNADALIAAHF